MYHFQFVKRQPVSSSYGIPDDAVFDTLGDRGFALMSPPLLETISLPVRKGNLSQNNWGTSTFVLVERNLFSNIALPEGCCLRDNKVLLIISKLV